MNRLESFVINHLLPHHPFAATQYIPKPDLEVSAVTVDRHAHPTGVTFDINKNSFTVPTGTTVDFEVSNPQKNQTVTIQVKDFRERSSHDPGALIKLPDNKKIKLTPKDHLAIIEQGTFIYRQTKK